MSDFDSRARKAAEAVRQQIAENAAHPEKGIRRAQRSPVRAAIPVAVARPSSAPSKSAIRVSNMRTVGLAKREY